MVENISNFCITVICTVMMIIILEMIMPEGKSKKYVIFICGIVITLVLIEPITNLMNIDLEDVLDSVNVEYEEIKSDAGLYEKSVKELYEENLINDVVSRLEKNGYKVSDVKVEYDLETLMPIKMYMNLESDVGYVQMVKIEVSSKSNLMMRRRTI